MTFISLQQALARVRMSKIDRQRQIDERLAQHDGFIGSSPSEVQQRFEQRQTEFESGDDDFPEFW